MDSHGRPVNRKSDSNLIPDLRHIPLAQLATWAANGEDALATMVSRVIGGQQDPAGISAMMFNSSI